jgi:hypothetical protein
MLGAERARMGIALVAMNFGFGIWVLSLCDEGESLREVEGVEVGSRLCLLVDVKVVEDPHEMAAHLQAVVAVAQSEMGWTTMVAEVVEVYF